MTAALLHDPAPQRRHISNTERARLFTLALQPHEKGRGRYPSPERVAALEAACLDLIRAGVSQVEIRNELNASRSQVSRWCQAVVRREGLDRDHRHLRSRDETVAQKLWRRMDNRGPEECWPWLGSKKANGYGSFQLRGYIDVAHRAVFSTFVAAIPEGFVVDHKCRNPGCVNPRHLQAIRQSENLYLAGARAGGDAA